MRVGQSQDKLVAADRVRAFSLVEMLVVVAVIGLLVTLITSVAGSAVYSQRRANTLNTMRVLNQAVGTFSLEDPLRLVYDQADRATFGSLPPYSMQLVPFDPRNNYGQPDTSATSAVVNSVPYFVEPNAPVVNGQNSISDRLFLDLSKRNGSSAEKLNWVSFLSEGDSANESKTQVGDNRALYAYLRAFSPTTLNGISDSIVRPLNSKFPDFFNSKGTGHLPTSPPSGSQNFPDAIPVLGFFDAWGVPLDYCQYVKIQADKHNFDNQTGAFTGYRVTERRAAFRSLGVDRDVYTAQLGSGIRNPRTWIWSEELPRPYVAFTNYGVLATPPPTSSTGGWTRLVGKGETYGYRPSDD